MDLNRAQEVVQTQVLLVELAQHLQAELAQALLVELAWALQVQLGCALQLRFQLGLEVDMGVQKQKRSPAAHVPFWAKPSHYLAETALCTKPPRMSSHTNFPTAC